MTGLACLFGLHPWSTIVVLEMRDGAFVEVEIVRCERCGMRAMETIL